MLLNIGCTLTTAPLVHLQSLCSGNLQFMAFFSTTIQTYLKNKKWSPSWVFFTFVRTEVLSLLVDRMEAVSWDMSYLSGSQSEDSFTLCLQHITLVIKPRFSKGHTRAFVLWHLTPCSTFISNQPPSFNNISCLSDLGHPRTCPLLSYLPGMLTRWLVLWLTP